MPSQDQLTEFAAWCVKHITGDEKGQAQSFSRFSRSSLAAA